MGIPVPVRRYIYIKTPQLYLLLRAYTKDIDKYETTSFGTVDYESPNFQMTNRWFAIISFQLNNWYFPISNLQLGNTFSGNLPIMQQYVYKFYFRKICVVYPQVCISVQLWICKFHHWM